MNNTQEHIKLNREPFVPSAARTQSTRKGYAVRAIKRSSSMKNGVGAESRA